MKTKRTLLLVALIFSTIALPVCGQEYKEESARLSQLLNLRAGSVVAEIGAGAGEMTQPSVWARLATFIRPR